MKIFLIFSCFLLKETVFLKNTPLSAEQERPDFTRRVFGAAKDVDYCLTNQDGIKAVNVMLQRSSDVGSGVATGFASRGNRSAIDSGKRNSSSRERSFAEQKRHRTGSADRT